MLHMLLSSSRARPPHLLEGSCDENFLNYVDSFAGAFSL